MVSKRTLILAMVALFALAGGPQTAGQSVFPVRFETEDSRNPASQTSTGGLSISTATNYTKSVTLDVTGNSAEDILDVTATEDDTTVMIRITAASRESDTGDDGSIREVFGWAIFDTTTNSWANVVNHPSIAATGGGLITVDYTPSGDTLTATVTTPGGHDLLTLTIEAVANKNVTFFEHF